MLNLDDDAVALVTVWVSTFCAEIMLVFPHFLSTSLYNIVQFAFIIADNYRQKPELMGAYTQK